MHDCRVTRERLIDLVYNEAGDADALRAEAEACPGCRAELRALTETTRAYERATAAIDPPEHFWAGYHSRLAARLHINDPARVVSSPTARLSSLTSRLRDALTTTWRVPVPFAFAVALLFLCLSVLALRQTPEPFAIEPPAQSLPSAQIRTIEVPVVRERVVTRTVYVERRSRATQPSRFDVARSNDDYASERRDAATARRGDMTARRGDAQVEPRADTLVGFRPAGDVKLRVVKGSYEHEK
jgi:hypothetical protein